MKKKYSIAAIAAVCITLLSCSIYFAANSGSHNSAGGVPAQANSVTSKTKGDNIRGTTQIVTVINENGEVETSIVTDKTSEGKKLSGTTSGSKSSSNSVTTAGNQTTTTKNQTTAKESTTTLQQSNVQREQNIYNTYGVSVLTGSDADVYCGTYCTGLTDEDLIAEWLGYIEKELARYPSGFFRDFRDITTFKIKLISNLNSIQGYASYEFASDMYIAINTDPDSTGFPDRMLNHEIMHIIDQYIRLKSWDSSAQEYISPLDATENIVPSGFSWGSDGNSYTIYDTSVTVENRYFVTPYAKTNGREDRAETFADYMFRPYKKDYMGSSSYPIPRKQAIIANTIRSYFPSAAKVAKGSLPWERFLY